MSGQEEAAEALWYVGPGRAEIREERLKPLSDGKVRVRALYSAISRGTEALSHSFALLDILPWGRQEEWQDVPDGWPQRPTYSGWAGSADIARLYGEA